MPFQGAVIALVLAVFTNVATVRWTNPNTQGLYRIDWYAQKVGTAPCSTLVAQYWGRGDPTDDLVPPKLKLGRLDSLYICMPAHSDSCRFNLWWFGCDSTGKRITGKSAVTSWLNRGRY